jgi:hypothetical protein
MPRLLSKDIKDYYDRIFVHKLRECRDIPFLQSETGDFEIKLHQGQGGTHLQVSHEKEPCGELFFYYSTKQTPESSKTITLIWRLRNIRQEIENSLKSLLWRISQKENANFVSPEGKTIEFTEEVQILKFKGSIPASSDESLTKLTEIVNEAIANSTHTNLIPIESLINAAQKISGVPTE